VRIISGELLCLSHERWIERVGFSQELTGSYSYRYDIPNVLVGLLQKFMSILVGRKREKRESEIPIA